MLNCFVCGFGENQYFPWKKMTGRDIKSFLFRLRFHAIAILPCNRPCTVLNKSIPNRNFFTDMSSPLIYYQNNLSCLLHTVLREILHACPLKVKSRTFGVNVGSNEIQKVNLCIWCITFVYFSSKARFQPSWFLALQTTNYSQAVFVPRLSQASIIPKLLFVPNPIQSNPILEI